MKKSKILAPALAILCLSTAASVTGTVAWFAANNIVTAFGMKVKSADPASLVIADSRAHTANLGIGVDFSAGAVKTLNPSTDKGTDTLSVPETTMDGELKTVINGGDVDVGTGLAKEGKTLNISGAATLNNHYFDFTVYLASAGVAYDGSNADLTKTINVSIDDINNATGDTIGALSVAFFVGPHNSSDVRGAYVGTLNLAGLDPDANDFTETLTEIPLLSTAGDGAVTIPAAAGGDGVRVDMRIYFDGALLMEAGKTYVATNRKSLSEVSLTATFALV